MKFPTTLSEMVIYTLTAKRYEPVARVKSLHHVPRGERHIPPSAGHVSHKYPIKGGITSRDVLVKSITRENVLFRKLCVNR